MPDGAPPIRVLRVIARLNVGGPARHVALLDHGLRRRGFETLLAYGDVSPDEASLASLVDDLGNPAVRVPHLGRRITPLGEVRAFAALLRLVFRFDPEVVHTHTAKAGTLGRLAGLVYNVCRRRRSRAVVVHTFHGNVFSGYFGPIASAGVRAIERALAMVTDRVVVIADQQRREVVETYGIASARKVSVVPLGLNLDTLLALAPGAPSLRRELDLDDADIVFGFVGRLAPIKDLPTLLRAFTALARLVPRARLVLAGDGQARHEVEVMIDALGIRERTRLAGWQRELPALYATFDVLVLSSRNEGTPVAAIEAMAARLPVVSTAAGGVVDLVEHDVTGLLVPVGDATALAAAMQRLADSAETRARFGAAGRRAAAGRHGHTRLVDDVEALYRSELALKRRGRRAGIARA